MVLFLGFVEMDHCKGVCTKFKAKKGSLGESRYLMGQKRCQVCCIYLIWDGLSCPCCHYRLRTRPRLTRYREAFQRSIKNKQASLASNDSAVTSAVSATTVSN